MSWFNSQYNKGEEHTLQFGTEDTKAFKYIEKCCQKVMDKAYGWISVKDRLPEKGQKVLFYAEGNEAVYVGKVNSIGQQGAVYFDNRQGRSTGTYSAKYWQPLPEPPESEG